MTPKSIMSLLNQIRSDRQIVLPADVQRDFVWSEEQIRSLMDSLMRQYPFGSLLFWQSRFREVSYREFVTDYARNARVVPKCKEVGKPLLMVLDGQQRLQSLYIALFGTYEGKQLYFNVTSGPGDKEGLPGDEDDRIGPAYRFEFWKSDDAKRPKRLMSVGTIATWPSRFQDNKIEEAVARLELTNTAADQARSNLRLLIRVINDSNLVPIVTIDEEASDAASALPINEILEIFVRVNSGGTRLSASDLMFSFLKLRWPNAWGAFYELIDSVGHDVGLAVDRDFVIRGLLMVTDAPIAYRVEIVQSHWERLQPAFEQFAMALRSTIDFLRSADVRILSRSLLPSIQALYPIIYYLYHFKNASVPDLERVKLRTFLYFLLFNNFLKASEARIRYLREVLQQAKSGTLPLEPLLEVISVRQAYHVVETSDLLLNGNKRLALNIAQPAASRETLSWQEVAEVDHIFPQALFRSKYPLLVDDIGNCGYLGKLRNIRKRDEPPAVYFKDFSDDDLRDYFLIPDRSLLQDLRFEEFLIARRALIRDRVRSFLGR